MREVEFLLVGGGMASAYCASELRKRGAEGSILLVGREPEPPYERPPLSKEYLRGEAERSDAYVNPLDWYEQNAVELLTRTNVMALDPAARTAKLQGGEEVRFDKALVATGAMVNILRVEGAELEGVHYLRAFGNSDAIREEAAAAEHVVLIGGSYIASEVAASLTAKGTRCTMVMMEDVALSRTFGDEVGRWCQEAARVARGRGDRRRGAGGVRGRWARAGDRDQERAGRSRATWWSSARACAPTRCSPQRAGLEVDDGIVCDAKLETLGARDLRRRRLLLLRERDPRQAPARRALGRGPAAGSPRRPRHARRRRALPRAAVLLQRPRRLDGFEYVGPAADWDEVVFRGDRDAGEFSAWYLKDGAVQGRSPSGAPRT